MVNRDTSNVSANDAQKQKIQEYEREREKTVARQREQDFKRIQDPAKRREVETMRNQRDHDLQQQRDMQEEVIQRTADDAVSRDKLHNHRHEHYSQEREDFVRTQVRQKMEIDFQPDNKQLEEQLNRKIDVVVERTLEEQRTDDREMSFKERLKAQYDRASDEGREQDRSNTRERDNQPIERKPS